MFENELRTFIIGLLACGRLKVSGDVQDVKTSWHVHDGTLDIIMKAKMRVELDGNPLVFFDWIGASSDPEFESIIREGRVNK